MVVSKSLVNTVKYYYDTSKSPVKEENCSFTNVLPEGCNFNTEIWDITDPATPFIKFNFPQNQFLGN